MAKDSIDKKDRKTVAENLRYYMRQQRLTQKMLAAKSGVGQTTVSSILDNEGSAPTLRTLTKISKGLRITSQDLLISHNIRSILAQSRPICVIDYEIAGMWKDIKDSYKPGEGMKQIFTEREVGENSFALEVVGESMLPDFKPGDCIIVDPDVSPNPGDFVIAKLDSGEKATFMKYRPRGNDSNGKPVIELAPLNNNYPALTISSENPGEIIGTVVDHHRRLK